MRREGLRHEPPEHVVADPTADRRSHVKPRQIDRRIRGAATQAQDQVIGHHQFASGGQVVDRSAYVIGHDNPRADNRGC